MVDRVDAVGFVRKEQDPAPRHEPGPLRLFPQDFQRRQFANLAEGYRLALGQVQQLVVMGLLVIVAVDVARQDIDAPGPGEVIREGNALSPGRPAGRSRPTPR